MASPLDYGRGARKPEARWWLWVAAFVPLLAAAYFYARPQKAAPVTDDFAARGAAQYQLQRMQLALVRFRIDTGRPPTVREGLAALLNAPPGLAGWRGPYIDKVQFDPWGRPYHYTGQEQGKGFVELFSAGPDGVARTGDDVSDAAVHFD